MAARTIEAPIVHQCLWTQQQAKTKYQAIGTVTYLGDFRSIAHFSQGNHQVRRMGSTGRTTSQSSTVIGE